MEKKNEVEVCLICACLPNEKDRMRFRMRNQVNVYLECCCDLGCP